MMSINSFEILPLIMVELLLQLSRQLSPPPDSDCGINVASVHCSTDASDMRNPDFVFHVEFQGISYTVNCRKRPGVDEFLEFVKGRFEVVIFTGVHLFHPKFVLDICNLNHEGGGGGQNMISHRTSKDS